MINNIADFCGSFLCLLRELLYLSCNNGKAFSVFLSMGSFYGSVKGKYICLEGNIRNYVNNSFDSLGLLRQIEYYFLAFVCSVADFVHRYCRFGNLPVVFGSNHICGFSKRGDTLAHLRKLFKALGYHIHAVVNGAYMLGIFNAVTHYIF